ncbi:MAG: invasion associated locus B family protein [Rhodospirillales bacterium]|nr:invasion associated locus B family protein [Rhodospirillales bacterium]
MRALPILSAFLAFLALPVLADTVQKPTHHAKTAGPKAIGTFEDWTAATNKEAGQTVCYAFTRARASAPALPGRGDVVLSVTERSSGRDAVAISAGFAFAANADGRLSVESASFDLYTAQRSAFARDGHAAVKAMEHGHEAVAHLPGPKGAEVSDTFSLHGFDKAYAAIVRRCPAGKPAA